MAFDSLEEIRNGRCPKMLSEGPCGLCAAGGTCIVGEQCIYVTPDE